MNYSDVIEWLKENGIKDEGMGRFFEFGKCIPYSIQRQMMNRINEPVLLCRCPAEIQPFYMQRDSNDNRLTESVNFICSFCFYLQSFL